MENRKQYLERQLIANVIKDKCAHCADILFEDAWCTQERCIRFTLPFFRALFPKKQNCGIWDSGDYIMFEVKNGAGAFEIVCALDSKAFPKEYVNDLRKLLSAFNASDESVLWRSKCNSTAPNKIFEFFDDFLKSTLPTFQKKILSAFISPVQDDVLEEGAVIKVTSTLYERNRKARELCLSYYGKTCQRCGLNFEKNYGAKYADVIEVHHILPLNKIGENYIVDPIKDLIPVCPNCHSMYHCEI